MCRWLCQRSGRCEPALGGTAQQLLRGVERESVVEDTRCERANRAAQQFSCSAARYGCACAVAHERACGMVHAGKAVQRQACLQSRHCEIVLGRARVGKQAAGKAG